ncbi:MAG: general secretion pathway protein GspE [Deltaproteobacteria bacterium]|nr:general secretion pathway protein GspE [Deltaproteobacteria bacterium]
MSELANVLLKLRAVTQEQLEEAIDAQILNGGRLGTNLVELGHITEQQLADALQTLHRVPALHGEIVPHESALSMIKPEWCDKHNLVPLRFEGGRLYIGLLSPYTPEQLRLLGERLGHEVQQLLIPEFRMNQLLRKYAKAFRPVRQVDLTHAAQLAGEAVEEKKEGTDELMSEEEFQSLYAQALSGGRHSSLEEAHAEHDSKPLIEAQEDHEASPLHGIHPPEASPLPPLRPTTKPAAEPIMVIPPKAVPLQPLSFAEAQAAISQIHDREGVAHLVMRFAAGKFKRALLFTLHGEVATGWEGVGEGLAGNRARRVAVPMAPGGPFALVRKSCSHFIGPFKSDPGIDAFFKLAGGAPQTALLMPILARGRVVNILYADHGAQKPTTPDIGELMILVQKVGRTYEEFLAKQKKAKLAALAVAR